MDPDYPRGKLRISSLQRPLQGPARRIFDKLVASRGEGPTAKLLDVSSSTVNRLMYGGKWRADVVEQVEHRLLTAPFLAPYRAATHGSDS
jgi:hypothetical protein